MKKLNELTSANVEAFARYRDEWLNIGLDTKPIDQEKARAAITLAYKCAGLQPPKIFVWLESPLRGAYGSYFLKNLPDQVWAQVRDQVWDQVRDQVWAQVWDQVGAQVRDQVWDQVGAQVRDQVGDQVRAQVYQAGYGLHDAGWLSFYDYFYRETGLECCAKDSGLFAIARECGWWWPFQNAVIVTAKPTAIHRDDNFRLHSETEMAIAYPDGWGIYAWHGVRVPEHVILSPETITTQQIKDEQNAEVRRIMVERMGWNKFVEQSEMKVIHSDTLQSMFPKMQKSELVDNSDPAAFEYVDGVEKADLLESSFLRDFEDRPLKFVRLTCPSTGKVYVQRVAHNEKRVYAAVGRSFGLTEQEYKTGKYIRQGDVLMWLLDQSDTRVATSHS